jgi:hypothetical protein
MQSSDEESDQSPTPTTIGFTISGSGEVIWTDPSSLVRIPSRAFYHDNHVTLVCIPPLVKVLGRDCFAECIFLQKVTFESGSSLRKIGCGAVVGSTSLHCVDIPASVELLCENCFRQCEGLARVTFESGSKLRVIDDGAFQGCRSLGPIGIPAAVERIGDHGFGIWPEPVNTGCSALTSVTFESGSHMREIGNGAFAGCSSLTVICIPQAVEVLGKRCFSAKLDGDEITGCQQLTTVTFESGSRLRIIGQRAFACCMSLEAICIPASVETLGSMCFGGKIGFDDILACEALTTVTFEPGSRLREIGAKAFAGCSSLRSIQIPSSIEVFGKIGFARLIDCPDAYDYGDDVATAVDDRNHGVFVTMPDRYLKNSRSWLRSVTAGSTRKQ